MIIQVCLTIGLLHYYLLQLTKYLDENNLICEKQYGFRKNHSTDYAALHIVDLLNYQLDANRTPVNFFSRFI